MGFNKVYKVLLEIFPEVDSRALRAVAIEHQEDAEAAVDVVLTEVIPYLASPSKSTSTETSTGEESPGAGLVANGTPEQDSHLHNAASVHGDEQTQFYDAETLHDQLFHYENGGLQQICGDDNTSSGSSTTVCTDVPSPMPNAALMDQNGLHNNHPDACGEDFEREETLSSKNVEESHMIIGANRKSPISLGPLEHRNLGINPSANNTLLGEVTSVVNNQENSCANGNTLEVENSIGYVAPSNVENSILSSPESSIQLVGHPDILNHDLEAEETYAVESTDKLSHVKDGSTLNTVIMRSAQICSTDFLEDIITDARNNKKTLLSVMESVISLMREVELQEKAAEQAREEVAEGGMELLKRVEDLKQLLQHAKEANDMHAGEVYGEKAILSTEVRELQSRLLSLSDERDKSLQILDEMHQSLEVRLAATEKEKEAAEKERLEKEDVAQKALAEQELVMEKVVQEANDLKKQSEENAKLREFLMDRGHVVDMLQGEISVICQDVRLLKEKFDEHLPLSKSLTSSQTSCILASSSSSSKGMVSELADQVTNQSDILERCPMVFSPEPHSSGPGTTIDDNESLIDDGWEIFL